MHSRVCILARVAYLLSPEPCAASLPETCDRPIAALYSIILTASVATPHLINPPVDEGNADDSYAGHPSAAPSPNGVGSGKSRWGWAICIRQEARSG